MRFRTFGFALGTGLSFAAAACGAPPGPPAGTPRPPATAKPSPADRGAPEAREPCSGDRERLRSANALSAAGDLIQADIRATEPSVISDGLRLILRECETCCSDPARALVWLKLGAFLASVRGDTEGASDAFERALSLDEKVALDPTSTPESAQRAFSEVRRRRGAAAPRR